jgi:cobaltochelatase CobS
MVSNEEIKCEVCGAKTHVIKYHLQKEHPEMTEEEYHRRFPDAPLLSEYAMKMVEQKLKEKSKNAPQGTRFFHEVFGFRPTMTKAMSSKGKTPIPISVLERNADADMIPAIDETYVFNVQELKLIMSAVEMAIPVYIWGHKGTGKTKLVEQICARTNRPMMRVQHTVNTEESQIVGQWVVRNGETKFEYGALPMAMINGWTYLADEYDFALPNVLATYQAVLEGMPLVIKEAPMEQRIVHPHPNFRFFATGNTNGTGDESGLYQGTVIQNSANYDRFGVVVQKTYLTKSEEIKILTNGSAIQQEDASDLVEFANYVRNAFDAGKIADTISPRTLLFAAKLGVAHASFTLGLTVAFLNKLSTVDREVCAQMAQRIFGEKVK